MKHLKTKYTILFSLLLLIVAFSSFPHQQAYATDTSHYDVLTPLPTQSGTDLTTVDTTDPVAYVRTLYQLLISLAVVVAVFIIVLGGVQYMMAGDNGSRVTEAKKRVQQALFGLLLLAGAYLILQAINPNLLDFESLFKDIQSKDTSTENLYIARYTFHVVDADGKETGETFTSPISGNDLNDCQTQLNAALARGHVISVDQTCQLQAVNVTSIRNDEIPKQNPTTPTGAATGATTGQ